MVDLFKLVTSHTIVQFLKDINILKHIDTLDVAFDLLPNKELNTRKLAALHSLYCVDAP